MNANDGCSDAPQGMSFSLHVLLLEYIDSLHHTPEYTPPRIIQDVSMLIPVIVNHLCLVHKIRSLHVCGLHYNLAPASYRQDPYRLATKAGVESYL